MTNAIKLPRRARLDFVLVGVAAISLAVLHLQPRSLHNLVLVLATPILYLVASKLATNGDLPSTAARSYLLCFLAGIAGLILHGPEALHALEAQLGSTDTVVPKLNTELISLIGELTPYLLGPLAIGVGLYTAFSVFELTVPSTNYFGSALEKLGQWLSESHAPAEVQTYLLQMVEQFNHLQSGCKALGDRAVSTEHDLNGMQSALLQCQSSLDHVAGSAKGLNPAMNQLALQVSVISSSIDQLRDSVGEIQNVVDDLSKVVSNKIMEL